MSMLANIVFVMAEGEPHRDDNGQIVTHSWIWPEKAELIYGTISSIIIFALLWKFAGPAIVKGFNARTERIRAELDAAATAQAEASAEAERIRTAKGDIDAERQRLFAEADAQAEALLADGRARLEQEVAELESRASAEVEAMGGRAGDELRAEIARIASEATDRVLAGGLDGDTQQALIESFISTVGASR
jgi:F-type H+-transporting ATPase subunit b